MKFTTGGLGITGLSGKLGGHVLNKNGTARVKRIPKNPQTSAQLNVRADLTTYAQGWAGLTETQRQAWETAAASGDWKLSDVLGNSFNPSGENLYVRLNMNIATISGTPIADPPTKVSAPVMTLGAVVAEDDDTFTLQVDGTLGTAHTLVVIASPQLSPGRMKNPKSLNRIIMTSATAGSLNISSAYLAKFGALALGKKIYLRVEMVAEATGQRSLVGADDVIVAAA